MKKALKVVLFASAIAMVALTGCKNGSSENTINLWAFTDEVPGMIEKYVATHPDFNFKLNTTIIATTDGAYQPALDQALTSGGKDAPDIYTAESAFVLKYTKGEMSNFAAPYKDLGIDIDNKIKEAEIAQYSVDLGTNPDGNVVGLGYQATGGCFFYRRSLAKELLGSDDPKVVSAAIGGGSQSWDKFWEVADKCKAKNWAIVSGDGDIWHAIENSSDKGWVVDGKLNIDPKREAFLDVSKKLTDEGLCNLTQDWQDAWFADMKGTGPKPVLGFFGPAWLLNYSMAPQIKDTTYGDWAICDSPVGFFWGGTWLMVNTNTSDAKKAAIKDIIEWITLDTTEDGLLYQWANGLFQWKYQKGADPTVNTKDAVSSGVVMAKSNGSVDILGGQNMFDYFVPANAYANGKCLTAYDETINQIFRDQVRAYAAGQKTRDEALATFKQSVKDKLDIDVD